MQTRTAFDLLRDIEIGFPLGGRWKVRAVLAWVVVGFVMTTYVVGGCVFIESAIERAEYYLSDCASIDDECRQLENSRVSLGEAPASSLNLFSHFSSAGVIGYLGLSVAGDLRSPLVATIKRLPIRIFPTRIFHPPRA